LIKLLRCFETENGLQAGNLRRFFKLVAIIGTVKKKIFFTNEKCLPKYGRHSGANQ